MAINKRTVFTEVKEAEEKRKKEISDLDNFLDKAMLEQETAETKAAKALENNDVDSYTNARADERRATDKIEYYEKQLKSYLNKPLFPDPDERNAKYEQIKGYAERVSREKIDAAAALLIEASHLVAEAMEEIDKSNKTLDALYKGTGSKAPTFDVTMLAAIRRSILVINENSMVTFKNWFKIR